MKLNYYVYTLLAIISFFYGKENKEYITLLCLGLAYICYIADALDKIVKNTNKD